MSLNESLKNLSLWIDDILGIRGSSGYILILCVVLIGHKIMNTSNKSSNPNLDIGDNDEEQEVEPPRNFTSKQLLHFDGTKDKTGEDKPVYLSVNGTVFDVSDGRSFYGPDGPYANFAGKECGIALAKMSFDDEHLNDLAGCENLNFGEKEELDGWVEKFTYYRNYPVKGRLVGDAYLVSLANRILTNEDLSENTGINKEDIPKGYAASPIYIGAGNKVFDASFGGVEFYGSGGGYNRFAGRDISRALAKMSFNAEDLENTNIDDLDDKQIKVLDDWIKTYEEKKMYPIVGQLGKKST